MAIATINPANGQTVKTFTELSDAEVEAGPGPGGGHLPHLPAHDLRRTRGLDAAGRRHPRRRGRRGGAS